MDYNQLSAAEYLKVVLTKMQQIMPEEIILTEDMLAEIELKNEEDLLQMQKEINILTSLAFIDGPDIPFADRNKMMELLNTVV